MQELCFMTNLTSEQWAAWVQAIGSIVAILAAVYIAKSQFRDALKLQKESARADRRRKYDALVGFVDHVLAECSLALDALKKDDREAYFNQNSTHELMDDCHEALRQVSPLDMPTGEGAKALAKLRDLTGTAAWNAKASFDETGPLFQDYQACAEALEHNIASMREHYIKLQAELT